MATKYCIDNNIMKDILLPMQAEVKKMLLTEYDEKKTLNFLRQETRKEALKEGHAAGRMDERKKLVRTMLQNGMSPEQIAQMAGLSLQEVLSSGNPKQTVLCPLYSPSPMDPAEIHGGWAGRNSQTNPFPTR